MKKSTLIVLLCALSWTLISCGNKVNTEKVENQKDKSYDYNSPIQLAPEQEDDNITVLKMIYETDADGNKKAVTEYFYSEDGRCESYDLYDILGKSKDHYIREYNEYGYPSAYYNTKTEEYSQKFIVDNAGYFVWDYGDTMNVDYNADGRFKLITDEKQKLSIEFTYKDQQLIESRQSMDGNETIYEYQYSGNGLSSYLYYDSYGDKGSISIKRTFNGNASSIYDACSYSLENIVTGSSGGVISGYTMDVDDRGVVTHYSSSGKDNSLEVSIDGEYNQNKSLFTMMSSRESARVRGYQIVFSTDGRPVCIFKVDGEQKRISEQPFCEYRYDDNGHLAEVMFGPATDDSGKITKSRHYVFTRVPKTSYKDSYFFEYNNILSPASFLADAALYLCDEK